MEKPQTILEETQAQGYTVYRHIVFGKRGNHATTYVCKLWNFRIGDICNIQKQSKKELMQHQAAKMHCKDADQQPRKRTLQEDQKFLKDREAKKSIKLKRIVVSPVKTQIQLPTEKKETKKGEGNAQCTPYTESVIAKLADLSLNAAESPDPTYAQSNALFASSFESILPVEHLQLWTNNQPVNMVTYMPGRCPNHKKDDVCYIRLNGKDTRERCFDTDSPFVLSFQKYQCSTHGHITFSLLNLDLKDYSITPQVVSFERTIVSTKLLDYIFMTVPSHCFNFTAMAKALQSAWIANLSHKIRMGFLTQVLSDNDVTSILKLLEQKFTINSQMIEALYLFKFGRQKIFFDNYVKELVSKSGDVLRVDHTYKIASALSAMDEESKKRIQIKASLLSILNEKGQVLVCKLVPSDERAYMLEEFDDIWSHHDVPKTTHVFTDDSRKDIRFVEEAWQRNFSATTKPKTCQDIWHVIHRIDSVMAHNHPAKQDLSGIFAKLCNSQDPSADDLSQMLNKWLENYNKAHQDRDEQMQLFIENLAATVSGKGSASPANYPSIITSKVKGALSNFLNPSAGYADAVLNSASLKEHSQGTSVNENWHKYLKKSSPFYSGSASFDLLVAVITHLQFLYNYSKEMRHHQKEHQLMVQLMLSLKLTAPFQLNAQTSLSHLLRFKTFQDLQLSHFTSRKANYPKVSDEDVAQCIEGLKRLSEERPGIPQGLLYWLQHEIFDEKYSKGYVKKIVYQVARKNQKQ